MLLLYRGLAGGGSVMEMRPCRNDQLKCKCTASIDNASPREPSAMSPSGADAPEVAWSGSLRSSGDVAAYFDQRLVPGLDPPLVESRLLALANASAVTFRTLRLYSRVET